MTESLVIAAILAICAVILWLRPQSISTLSGNPEENPEINWRAVRRIGAGGLLLLAVVIGGGSWLLLRAGVEPQTITVLGIPLLFIGAGLRGGDCRQRRQQDRRCDSRHTTGALPAGGGVERSFHDYTII